MQRAGQGVFQPLTEGLIAAAAARGQVDLSLVTVDSKVAPAHHDAAGMAVSKQFLATTEKAVEEGKGGARAKGANSGREDRGPRAGGEVTLRRCRQARLKAAELGRSRGGLTSKVHRGRPTTSKAPVLIPVPLRRGQLAARSARNCVLALFHGLTLTVRPFS
jgi:hypothetical protein